MIKLKLTKLQLLLNLAQLNPSLLAYFTTPVMTREGVYHALGG